MRLSTLCSVAALLPLSALAAPEVHYDLCQEPFYYRGVTYLGTTDKDNDGTQWCYLKTPKSGSSWGNVRLETIPPRKTLSGQACSQTTGYQGETVYGCTSRNHHEPWCYLPSGAWEACEAPAPAEPLLAHTQPQATQTVSTLALGSCFKELGSAGQAMERVIEQDPDLFLWLGDNIYGDTTDMTLLRQKYDAKKRSPYYERFLEAEIPVMATWDDHDYGANNSGAEYSRRAESQLEFLRHFDIPEGDPRYGSRDGVYSAQLFGSGDRQLHVIMLDARYHRSPTFSDYGRCEGDNSSMLGEAQWAWLEQELARPSEIKVIGSGIQVLPPLHRDRNLNQYCAYGDGKKFNQAIANLDEETLSGTEYESWAEFPLERERLLRLVQKSINEGNAKTIVFVSGDQHWGELLQKDLPASAEYGDAATLYEITASGFGQNWPYAVPNPNRMPVWADYRGSGSYDKRCVFPFSYGGVQYRRCTSEDHDRPWCYLSVDASGKGVAGEWGNCAAEGATIPTGSVGVVADDVESLSTADRHLVNKPGSNYGFIRVDWQKRELRLSLETESEEAVSTLVKF
ncbi:alkaline phosphatase D family protein [Microbulbifer taiwanensis]|uniref:Alkaline phosphatase D family protein n=1 Tax=Microbulbifer taiwanensis TaxID=986746 RepID=A0ABW1YKH1_9GAMM|nr:alkaline phosphatase D family protein [Microbulbifer taiwanensis]